MAMSDSQRVCVAIEVGHSKLNVVIVKTDDKERMMRCQSIPWRRQASALQSAQGLEELKQALEELVRRENLQNTAVDFLLDGEFCVTRYAGGTEDEVHVRLDEFQKRGSRYLLLGHGRKTAERVIRTRSEDKVQGLLTVANERTLTTISTAASAAGIVVNSICASVLRLAEVIQLAYPEHQQSGLLVRPRETGVDVAVVDAGLLLLDVRPVQKMSRETLNEYLDERIALLQRFYSRCTVGAASLQNVFFCGASEEINLNEKHRLTTLNLEMKLSGLEVPVLAHGNLADFGGAIGSVLGRMAGTLGPAPNLLNGMLTTEKRSGIRLMAECLWPLAIGLLLALGAQLLTAMEEAKADVDPIAVSRHAELSMAQMDIDDETHTMQERMRHLIRIRRALKSQSLNNTISGVTGCLADDTAVASISLDREGVMTIQGSSLAEENIYQLVDHLESLPFIQRSTLSGTGRSERDAGSRTEFHVQAHLNNSSSATGDDDA